MRETGSTRRTVPSCWELIEKDYEGVAFSRRTFKVPQSWAGKVIRLQFDAVNFLCEVWINDQAVGVHEGGFTPFEFRIDSLIKPGEENTLILRVAGPILLQDKSIDGNLIYRAMTELHDGGGIYCFAGNGLVLRGNFIRDIIDTGGYGASAYYLDERSENCIVEGNLSVGIVRPSHNHMAKNNTIRNNVFITKGDMRLTFPRSSGFTFEKNVLLAAGKIIFTNPEGITTWS